MNADHFDAALALAGRSLRMEGQEWVSLIRYKSEAWVCWNGKALLRLAAGVRVRHWAVRGHRVIILCSDWRVINLPFSKNIHAYPYPERCRGYFVVYSDECHIKLANSVLQLLLLSRYTRCSLALARTRTVTYEAFSRYCALRRSNVEIDRVESAV
jgi:hypothetical protein